MAGEHLIFRNANEKDIDFVFHCSNEISVRENSINNNLIYYSDHKIWFKKKIIDKSHLFWILLNNDNPCGIIRFELSKKLDHLSYLIAKNNRGNKFGKKMIELAIKKKKQIRTNNIIAITLVKNEQSIKTLESCGFILHNKKKNLLNYIYKYKEHEKT